MKSTVSFYLASKQLVLHTYLCFSLLSSFTECSCSLLLACSGLSLLASVSGAVPHPPMTTPSLILQHCLVPGFISSPPLEQVLEPYLSSCLPSQQPSFLLHKLLQLHATGFHCQLDYLLLLKEMQTQHKYSPSNSLLSSSL